MPQSTSSRLSSPLSSQPSPGSDTNPLPQDASIEQDNQLATGSQSPGGRSQRSGTSSTVLLERPEEDGDEDDESALSALSSDDEHSGQNDDENEQGGGEWDMDTGQYVVVDKYHPSRYRESQDSQLTPSREGTSEPEETKPNPAVNVNAESDSGSLSPPPPSSETKPKPLPTVTDTDKPINPKVELQDSDESELESLTDSNAEDRPQESNEEPEETTGGQQTESGSVSEQPEEEDGDVTMRAGDLGTGAETEDQEDRPNEDESMAEGLMVDEGGAGTKDDGAEGEQETNVEEDTLEQDEIDEAPASPALSIQPIRPHSSHPPPPTSAAVKALFGLEIKFAALRDRLYIERMEETAAEEEMILNGTHPAVSYLFKNLRARRERLHEVASRRHKQVQEEILKVKDDNKDAVWTWWTDERDREQWEEFEQTWAKRRRLIREKSELDSAPTRRPKVVPKTWADMPKPLDWAAGAVPASMSASDAANDLALMDLRRQQLSRHASPAVYQNPNTQSYPQYYHPEEYQHPHYAQRVPQPQPVHRPPQPQVPLGSNSQGFGPAVFQEPRREGRTVPTSSALFDNGNGRRSNDQLPHVPQPPVQPQVQGPPPPPASLGADLWGKDSRITNGHESNGFGASTGTGNANGTGRVYRMWNNHTPMPKFETSTSNGNGNGGSNGIEGGVNPASNGNTAGPTGNGNGNPILQSTNGHLPKDPSPPNAPPATTTEDLKPTTAASTSTASNALRYPGLAEYLTPTPAPASQNNQQQQQPQAQAQTQAQVQKVGTVSPPKSSLGITGIPSGMPFI